MYISLASLALLLSALPSTLALPRPRSNSQCVKPTVRKEWRSLTTAEQADFVQATSCLGRLPHNPALQRERAVSSIVPEINNSSSAYDDFVFLHIDLNTHFHYTGLFFPWHRWYIHAFEQTLKEQCGFRGTVPYWDWSLDVADMENMTILSDDPIHGMGRWGNASNDDQITTGGWKDFRVSYPVPNGIRRKYTILPFPNATAGPLFPDPTRLSNETLTREKVEGALHDCAAGDFVCFQTHVEGFQNMHGGGHSVLGGDMYGNCPTNAPPTCAWGPEFTPNDPIFFLHHVNHDRIWSDWQAQSPENAIAFTGGSIQDKSVYTTFPTGRPPLVTLNTTLPTDGLFDEWTVADVMDIQGDSLCYSYDTHY